jgi:membrane-associated protein
MAAPIQDGTYFRPIQAEASAIPHSLLLLTFIRRSGKRSKGSPQMFETLKHLLTQLYDPKGLQALVEWGGTTLVCIIVFIETGMFVGFFLPGDSLLVTAGVFAAAGHLKIVELLTLVTLCAIAGDQVGYWIGRKAGQNLYRREDSRFFKKRHLQRAHDFYEHYGGKTIIIARFVPIIRTFCPPVAGAAGMTYPRYLAYDVVGGCLWVWGMTLLGYTLGRTVPNIDKHMHYVIAIVIFVSLMPAMYQALKSRLRGPASPIKNAE